MPTKPVQPARTSIPMIRGAVALGVSLLFLSSFALQGTQTAAASHPPRCAEPHPCGYRWDGGGGPFVPLPVEHVQVTAHDGVVLDGWLRRPRLPKGVRAPVVLHSSPYYGQQFPTGDQDIDQKPYTALPVDRLVREGYVVAMFSVRGTGNSGGCLQVWGPDEQRDQATLVNWLAKQPWSNGRVGMGGLSYHGTTPVEAAIQNPRALKTIVIAGTVLDAYTFFHSPQGALTVASHVFPAELWGVVSGAPPALGHVYDNGEVGAKDFAPKVVGYTVNHVGPRTQRLCKGMQPWLTAMPTRELVSDVRAPEFWAARRMIDRVPKITAATWVVHGLNDRLNSGHAFQEDWAWGALRSAPKRMLLGQWAHLMPYDEAMPGGVHFEDELLHWFDYWLKGYGKAAPGLGRVDYADDSGKWRRSDSWPPSAAHNEVLYLKNSALTPTMPASAGTMSFDPSLRDSLTDSGKDDDICMPQVPGMPSRLVYTTAPATKRTVIAGNPLAWLTLSADQDGGLIGVDVFRQVPDGTCEGARLTEGAADLRFYNDTHYVGTPFPINKPQHMRIDIANQAVVLQPGDRLVVVFGMPIVQSGSATQTDGPFSPTLTLQEGGKNASHLVIPVIEGGFGGAAPTITYPLRPFQPRS